MTDNRPITYDHLKSKKKPTIKKIRLSTNDDLQEAYEEALGKFELAENSARALPESGEAGAALVAATEELEAAKAAALEASIVFTFRSVGRKRYDALIEAHPPTQKQRDEVKALGGDPDQVGWNAETFPQALVAASLVEPELTEEQVNELWDSDDWSSSEIATLTITALDANNSRRVIDLGNV